MDMTNAVSRYLSTCKAENLCEDTIRDKRRHLSYFSFSQPIRELRRQDFYNVLNVLNKTEIVKYKIKRDLRAFLKWCNEEGLSTVLYTSIKNKLPCENIRPHILKEEYDLLINYSRNLRERTIVTFLWETGLRCGELVSLKVCDILPKEHEFVVKSEKTNKSRYGYFASDIEPYIKLYKPQTRLFPYSTNFIRQMIRNLRKFANIQREITPHSFRHAFITRALDQGMPIQDVAILAGHSKVQTTIIYYHQTDLKKKYKKYLH